MLDIILPIVDIILNIAVVVVAARWAAQHTGRVKAIAFACAVGLVYGVASDVAFSFVVSGYDTSLIGLAINAQLGILIDIAIAYLATRRAYALAAA